MTQQACSSVFPGEGIPSTHQKHAQKAHSSVIHSIPKLETTQTSMSWRTNKQIMVYLRKEPYRSMTENCGYTQRGENHRHYTECTGSCLPLGGVPNLAKRIRVTAVKTEVVAGQVGRNPTTSEGDGKRQAGCPLGTFTMPAASWRLPEVLRGGEIVVCNRPQVRVKSWRLKHRQRGCQCHCASLFPLQEVRQGPLSAQNRL